MYMVLGDAVSKLETFVWILKHISRFIAWSLFILKASYLVNDQSQHDLSCGGVIQLLKFETRPSFLLNFGTANKVKGMVMLLPASLLSGTWSFRVRPLYI